MDKLRALQYFAAAAEERSFSRAARRFGVSVPAVAKMINALERHLGSKLIERTTRGIALTADGQVYLEACLPAVEQITAADTAISGAAKRPRGTLVLGAVPHLAQHCILPALPQFRALYPEIEIDIRSADRVDDVDPSLVDLYILQGWPEQEDMILQRIASTRLLTVASPDYWAAHTVPKRPADLARHACLCLRNPDGQVLDLWEYERGKDRESVTVNGWLVASHRDILLDAVIAGEGVARLGDMTIRGHLQSGRLVPALLDWEMKGAPPVNLLYRPNLRRTPRVRVFIEFVTSLFHEMESDRKGAALRDMASRPDWHRRRFGRASTVTRSR